jgi:hypothetical protein
MIFYNSLEPMTPKFGSLDDIGPPALSNGDAAVGAPANLLPHTVFDTPVKIFIPCPGVADVSHLKLYHYNGIEWQLASDENGNILPGGEGWMVPGSRVNHNDVSPPLIEVQVHHFSAAQAVGSVSADSVADSSSGDGVSADSVADSSGGGGGGCFISSAGEESSFSLLSLLSSLGLLSLLGLWSLLTRFNPLRSSSSKN